MKSYSRGGDNRWTFIGGEDRHFRQVCVVRRSECRGVRRSGIKWEVGCAGRCGPDRGQHCVPPPCADAVIADGEPGRGGHQQKKQNGADPAHTKLKRVAALDAGFADIGGKVDPVAVVVDGLAGSLEKALRPILLVQAHGSCITAHDALAEDASGKQAELLLLQRLQVAPADFGNRGDLLQRNAARQPLHAQVFSKVSHRRPQNRDETQKRIHLHNKPGLASRQRVYRFFPFFSSAWAHLTGGCGRSFKRLLALSLTF